MAWLDLSNQSRAVFPEIAKVGIGLLCLQEEIPNKKNSQHRYLQIRERKHKIWLDCFIDVSSDIDNDLIFYLRMAFGQYYAVYIKCMV